MTRSPDRYANETQQKSAIEELHALVDFFRDNWTTIQKHAKEYGRGVSSASITATRSGGISDPTSLAAEAHLDGQVDHAEAALTCLTLLDEARAHMITTARAWRRQLPLTEKEKEKAQKRQNTVYICHRCKQPIIGQARMINDEPHHLTDEGQGACYYIEWRAGRSA